MRALLLLLLLAAPAAAQARAGHWNVQGTDAALGAYTGEVELTSTGAGTYSYARQVTFNAVPGASRPLTTLWTGTARDQGVDLVVTVSLKRMGWATKLGALQRTAADKVPVTVSGTFRPDASGALAGSLSGGASANEVLRRAVPVTPMAVVERRLEPMHSAPPALVKSLLFALFSSYHARAEVAPYRNDPRFRAAVHLAVVDRTGFDFLRARPNQLLLVDQTVDALSLAEAEVRRSAFGPTLAGKAALADADAEGRHLDPVTGILPHGVRQGPSGLEYEADMSAFLWNGCYLYGQAARFQVTQDPVALRNVERVAGRLCDMIEIDPAPGEFARSLREAGRTPIAGSWHAGAGTFSRFEWHDNGNNDMIKGLYLGVLGAWDVLPQGHPLRPRLAQNVRDLADHWMGSASTGTVTGNRRNSPGNKLLLNMLAHWVTGDRKYESVWRGALRSPRLLLELASGGTFSFWGIADWSGTHLGVVSNIALVELGKRLNSGWSSLFELSLENGYRFTRKYARTTLPWSVARGGLLRSSSPEAKEISRWGLREFPHPKPQLEVDHQLDPEWCASPYPSLPWKFDWMNGGRFQGLLSYPQFQRQPSNYVWRSGPFDVSDPASATEFHSGDYLWVYWLARRTNVVSASD